MIQQLPMVKWCRSTQRKAATSLFFISFLRSAGDSKEQSLLVFSSMPETPAFHATALVSYLGSPLRAFGIMSNGTAFIKDMAFLILPADWVLTTTLCNGAGLPIGST